MHREALTHSKLLFRASFYAEKLLHTASSDTEQACTQRSYYTQKLLHTTSFYTEKLSRKESATQDASKWRKKCCPQSQQRGTLTQPFHCDLQRLSCKAQKHSVNKEGKQSPLNPQLHCARRSNRNRRQSDDARNRHAREPTFLRNGTSVYPKKRNVACKS